MWASWAVFAVALSWQQAELGWDDEVEALLRKQSTIFKKICAGEHEVADIAEQVCLSCEEIQRDWIEVLGATRNPRGRCRSRRASGNVGGGQ